MSRIVKTASKKEKNPIHHNLQFKNINHNKSNQCNLKVMPEDVLGGSCKDADTVIWTTENKKENVLHTCLIFWPMKLQASI